MNLSDHLTLEEFVASQTASRKGIDNQLPADLFGNAKKFATTVFEPVRALVNRPIVVSSGYRCVLLNQADGGAPTSYHLYALAGDLICPGLPLPDFYMAVVNSIITLPIDQLIYEYAGWVHAAAPLDGREPRRQLLMKFADTGYLPFDLDVAKARTPGYAP